MFYRKFTGNRNEKNSNINKKPIYLGLLIMYEFRFDYIKPKYGENAKCCHMDMDSFIVHVKTDGIYKDIAKDVETRFDISDFEIYSMLPKEKN